MKEILNIENKIEHPDPELQKELVLDSVRLKHLHGSELIDTIKKRVEIHNGECEKCRRVILTNIKFY